MRALLWFVLVVAGVVVAGSVLVWLVKVALGLVAWLAVAALVVGGGVYLYRRLTGTRTPRQLR